MPSKEIWITGNGIVSAIGSGVNAHIDAISNCKSGLKLHNFFNGTLPDPCMTGLIPEDVLPLSIDESAAERANLLAEIAFKQTFAQASIESNYENDLIMGTTLGNMHGGTMYYKYLKKNENPDIDLVKSAMPGSVGKFIANKYNIRGKCITVSSACASGITAIGTALNRIEKDHCERAYACGVDALSPFVIAGFNSLRLLSKKECRPFSADRDGLNPGEGAACILLEEKEAAVKRNALPLAKVTGYGTALEAYHYTKSHPEGMGVTLAIRKALKKANVNPDQIDHIHAHGTATVFNDLSEYNGYYNVFGDKLSEIPVCSTKSMTGHTFAAAGIIAAVLTVLSIKNQCVPPTLFCECKDQLFDKLLIYDKPTGHEIKRALVVAIGFGGEVAALVMEGV